VGLREMISRSAADRSGKWFAEVSANHVAVGTAVCATAQISCIDHRIIGYVSALRSSSRTGVDDTTQFRRADDVIHTDARCFFGRCNEIRRQVITGGMRPLFVVVTTPDSADVVEMLFRHDHELVQTFEFQSLNETLAVCPKVG